MLSAFRRCQALAIVALLCTAVSARELDLFVVFGDSLSDTGNVLDATTNSFLTNGRPTTPWYQPGRFTGGPSVTGTGETIDFSVTGTINLTLGQLVIFKDLNITGPGPGQLTIDAAGNDATPGTPNGMGSRIFLVNDFDGGNDLNVAISGLTLQNGNVAGPGGGIYNREHLNVTDIVLSDNSSTGGARNTH